MSNSLTFSPVYLMVDAAIPTVVEALGHKASG